MDDEARGRNAANGGDRVRGWVEEDFALDLVSMDEVEHGADDKAQLWRGNAADGARYAVKLSGGGTPAGLVVTAHLAREDVRGIAAPVPTRQGRLWSDRAGRRLSVVPWVSDHRALAGPLGAAHWTAYGELLAQVHATAATDEVASLLPREDHTHEQLASTARALEWECIGGVLAFAPVTTEEQSWFFEGYGDIDLDPARLAYYRCTRALVDLVDPAAQAADVRLPERERADAMSIVEGVLSPTGLVNLALSHFLSRSRLPAGARRV